MKKLILLLIICSITYGQSMKLPIIPVPRKIEANNGAFALKPQTDITAEEPGLQFTASLIRNSLIETKNIKCDIRREGSSAILLQIVKEKPEGIPDHAINEAYHLEISGNNIIISAWTAKGVFYGAMSLIQLLENSAGNELPAVKITDWPDMKVRGISDDISRGQVSTLENFKKIIRFIARYKMNTYMPYLEDMLQFDAYPSIGRDRGALTKAEVKELIKYASDYYVDIVPIFQTLGHYENILTLEEYMKFAEFPGAASLNVSLDETYTFLETMMKEVFEMFPSEYFHMGADESYDVGLGFSKHLVKNSNLAMVHLEHYKKVYAIAKKHGKKVLMYGDIILNHPEILEGLPKDITIVDWHYRPQTDYPSTKTFKDAGHEYYVSPSVWNFLTPFPTNVNAVPNIKYIIQSGLKNGAAGMINSNWGDYGAETFREFNYFGYAWSAQCAWSFDLSNESEFAESFFSDFLGTDDDRAWRIYSALNNPLNQMMWHEVWRHPLLPFRDVSWWESNISAAGKVSWLNSTLPMIKKDFQELKKAVKKNSDHTELISFILNLTDFYVLKLNTQMMLQDKLNGRETDHIKLSSMIDENISRIKELKEEFTKCWLRYYKSDNLTMIHDKFSRLQSYFTETKEQVLAGKVSSPVIRSEWIYHKLNDTSYAKSAEFRKTFTLPAKPASAYLQLMGDTYVKLYINGKYVDQVYARRSLSLLVDYRRIRFIDITKYLIEGNNTITVQAQTFNARGDAGFNLISSIDLQDKNIEILSDTTWESRSMEDGAAWSLSAAKRYPFVITGPDFKTKRTSWIER